jgi:hypothetical protein
MQERLTPVKNVSSIQGSTSERDALEHGTELVGNTLEQLLDSCRVTNEGDSHLETSGRDVALSGEDVVGDPLDEVRRVLVLDDLHLLLDLLHRNLTTEHGGDLMRVASVSWLQNNAVTKDLL